jgi:3-hydroxyisobutyrate dehydrogenase/glyoxylate/succinic semialdehyde reductase
LEVSQLKVGFIGLGIMGSRMASRLRAHGFDLVVFNRTRNKAETLLSEGAKWADSPVAAAADADVVFTMLPHPEAVAATALGANGFLSTMRAGTIWVNCSTVNPSFAQQMELESRARGIRYLDAPVTGSKDVAASGKLTFLVGGEGTDLDVCRPLLDAMGSRIVHVGRHGLGSAMKMVNNLMIAVTMAALSEGISLGQSRGVPRPTIFDTLAAGPLTAPIVAAKREKIESKDYDADFSMRWLQKDLHLASVSAYESGVAMPVVNAAKELYRLAMREGYADQDFSAIYEFLHQPVKNNNRQEL